jgi:hypothetical protein
MQLGPETVGDELDPALVRHGHLQFFLLEHEAEMDELVPTAEVLPAAPLGGAPGADEPAVSPAKMNGLFAIAVLMASRRV